MAERKRPDGATRRRDATKQQTTRRRPAAKTPKADHADVQQDAPRSGVTRMFVMTVPGLGRRVGKSIAAVEGATVQHIGYDGRSDVVVFEVDRHARRVAVGLATAEDVFVEVGRTLRAEGDNARWIAQRIWKSTRVDRALSVWANEVRPLSAAMSFRVISRVLQERTFLRTELRRQVTLVINREKPRWKFDDPAQMEVWIVEYQAGKFVAGLRLSDAQMRRHEGRATERQGALRPTVAAMMVELAGPPKGLLLDPCCGSGTLLAEARAAGWDDVAGSDIDPDAIDVARTNVPDAEVGTADARQLDLADGSVRACVSNLPFGQQFEVQGDMNQWLNAVLREMARITVDGGQIVLLAPKIPRIVVPASLHPTDQHDIVLLGTRTSIWCYEKRGRVNA